MSRSNGRPELEVVVNVRKVSWPIGFLITSAGCHLFPSRDCNNFVISNQFIDGFAYSKNKLEDAFRPGGILEKPPPKPHKEVLPSFVKKEDVEIIVRP